MKKIIGIVGSKEKRVTSYILGEVLKSAGYVVKIMCYEHEVLSDNLINNICINEQKDIDIIILEINVEKIKDIHEVKLNLDIIIDIDMTLDKYKEEKYISRKTKLVNTLKKDKLLIINTDDKDSSKLSCENRDAIVMTYGLNLKSSVTASSLNLSDKTKFNLCLQRKLNTIYDNEVDQFEYPMEMNLIGIENLYSALAAISASLYFDINLELIAKTLLSISGIKRRLKKLHEENFIILDSFAESPSDYESVLYNVQNLDYKELIIMNMISGDEGKTDREIADIIKGWSEGINLKSLVTVIDISNIHKIDYYKSLSKKNIDYHVCCELERGIEDCLLKVEKGDAFLILGGMDLSNLN